MNRRQKFYSIDRQRELGFRNERATRDAIVGSTDFMQRLKLEAKLDIHRGCVNTISWNDSGYRILSGSDDKQLCISDPYTRKKLTNIASGHRANIFSAKFMPMCNDSQIVSCSGDGQIAFNDVENSAHHGEHMFNCHYGTAYEVVTVPNDPYTFLSCGEDGTVRWFDLRIKNKCTKEECREDVLINCRRAVTSLAINPIMPYHLGVGCSDSSVRVFDRRMLGTRSTGNYSGRGVQGMFCRFCPSHLQNKYSRPTSLQYSTAGNEILVSYSSDYIYLFGADKSKKETVWEQQEGLSEISLGASGGSAIPDVDENPVVNPIKRLRLRGDWSDTGPKARPRAEQAGSQPRLTIIQRMSEMLTRWLDDTTSSHARRAAAASSGEAGHSQEQPLSDTAGPSTSQQTVLEEIKQDPPSEVLEEGAPEAETSTTSHFSSLQRTSTEHAASAAIQRRLKDAMTSQIKAKKQTSTADEASTSNTNHTLDDIPSIKPLSTLDTLSLDTNQRSDRDRSSQEQSKDINVSESEKLQCEDCETLPTEFTAGISAISSSVQSCLQISPKNSKADEKNVASDSEDHCEVTEGKVCVEMQSADNNKTDSKKRKRSPYSSTSGSLTDDPTLEKDHLDMSGKLRSKRNSKNHRKVTREESSASDSSSSDSEFNKIPKKYVGCRDDGFSPTPSRSADSNRCRTDSQDVSHSRDLKLRSCSENLFKADAKMNESEKQQLQEAEVQMECKASPRSPKTSKDTGHASLQKFRTTDQSHAMETCKEAKGTVSQRNEECHAAENQSTIFAFHDRMEDTNPQERKTGQYSVFHQRQRRVSVSGPAGTPPPISHIEGTSSQDTKLLSVGDLTVRPVGATGSSVTTGDASPESPSITCSESDSDDDLILRPPRLRRRHRRRESEETRRPRPPSVTESRLRELFLARREAREKGEIREKGEMQLDNIDMPEVKMVYKGHRNSRTMIKQANFWGSNFVLSGSDCGHIFIWDQHTAELVMLLEGDRHVVNCVQPHPFDHWLATSGIDYDVKLWSPTAEMASVPDDAAEVMRINELMLDETRDTITVPPSFMLRMLASLNHLREERRRSRESPSSSDSTEDES